MMGCCLALVLSSCAGLGKRPQPPVRTGGVVSLFNGEDLSGWVKMGPSESFAVKDGCILSTGKGLFPAWLRTEREYENFELSFEWRYDGWSEGGVFIHAPLDGPGSKMGEKLYLFYTSNNTPLRSAGAIYDIAAPTEHAINSKGKWNRCQILCDWPMLRVTMNGTVVQDLDMEKHEELKYRLRSGYIGIESLGTKGFYRNLKVRELPSKESWTDLLAGGLDSFTFYEGGKKPWTLEGDLLTGKAINGYAITKQRYEGPFEMQVWVRTTQNGNGGIFYRWDDVGQDVNNRGRGPEIQVYNVEGCSNTTGSLYNVVPASRVVTRDNEWFLMQVFSDGPRTMVRANGELMCESSTLKPPHNGRIAFQQHTPGATVEFRNPRIKKLVNWKW